MNGLEGFEGARDAARRAQGAWRGRPSLGARIVTALVLLALIGAAGLLVVSGLIFGAAAALIGAAVVGWRALRGWWVGRDTLRRNVRVVRRP